MPKKKNTTRKKASPTKSLPVFFFLPENKRITGTSLTQTKMLFKGVKDGDILYVVIKSKGGNAYDAVRVIRHLRTRFKTLIGIVPDYAYSAATLMLLGMDKILVSPEGFIGPIDKPQEHTDSGEAISALDVTNSINNIASLVSAHAITFYRDIRRDNIESIPKKDALDVAWNTALKLSLPLVAKMDPILLQKAYRDLQIGLSYGLDLLSDGMFKNSPYSRRVFHIANTLVNDFPSHGYNIFREEMRSLGLKVNNLENFKHSKKILEKSLENSGKIIYIENIYAK